MQIRSFTHAGLRRFDQTGAARGVPPAAVDKLRNMLTFLRAMKTVDELRTLPTWKAHRLSGNRADTWALHVTRNWRLTFRIVDHELTEVNLEDYH